MSSPSVDPAELTYGSYLHLDELLSCQVPATDEHDELLFVIIHQVYELWFKQILHELAHLQRQLGAGNGTGALHTARRVGKILKTIVGQLDVLETMTPRQFAAFRPRLGTSSGFQSNQFRELEAVMGRRTFSRSELTDQRLQAAVARPSMYDSLVRYLAGAGYDVPASVLERDVTAPADPDAALQAVLSRVYEREDAPIELCEAYVDVDEGVQEWRYRHVKMVERIIGARTVGTGGSSGSGYLQSTLFRPAFPDLWEIRGR